MTDAIPLTDDQIDARLAARAGWTRDGDTITRTFAHTYHECVHLAMYVAAKAREIGHHPDIDIRWQRIRFSCTTHDADHRITGSPDHRITGSPDHRITGSPDHRITGKDFILAARIDAIAAGHGATPAPAGDQPPPATPGSPVR